MSPRWGRWGRGHGRGAQPRRIRRFLEPALLLLLHLGPRHGYALVEGLSELGLENYPADVSAIYRTLYDLEANGMLTSHEDSEGSAGPPRRIYHLTEAGDAYLRAWVAELRETDRLLHRFLEAYDRHRQEHEPDEREE
ncbi:MAG: helix-turn-helix transcriptional regulator [Chloroflexi bacterium]|nr:helix-turn-helix transcriptional regulator [Chloroflexota bacterium]